MALTNQGTIIANQTIALTIDPSAGGFDNPGSLIATGVGGMKILTGPFTTSGNVFVADGSRLTRTGEYFQTTGTTTVEGQLIMNSLTNTHGGVLRVSGLVDGGDLLQTFSATLEIGLGGLVPGVDFGQVTLTGSASLRGTLKIVPLSGFLPTVGETYDIITLTSPSIGGLFDGFASPMEISVTLQPDKISPTFVRVTILSRPGDSDFDQDLDTDDHADFAACMTGPSGGVNTGCNMFDFDADNVVDLDDWSAFEIVFTE